MLAVSLVDPEALRRAREAAGVSQAQLARVFGLAGGEVVYNWERGHHAPRESLLVELASALGVELITIFRAGPTDLRRLRVLAGLSVDEAAEAVGVSDVTYRRWERGLTVRGPNRAAVQVLAGRFGVSVSAVESAARASVG